VALKTDAQSDRTCQISALLLDFIYQSHVITGSHFHISAADMERSAVLSLLQAAQSVSPGIADKRCNTNLGATCHRH
jgi:hypothetical protein